MGKTTEAVKQETSWRERRLHALLEEIHRLEKEFLALDQRKKELRKNNFVVADGRLRPVSNRLTALPEVLAQASEIDRQILLLLGRRNALLNERAKLLEPSE